MSTRYVEVPAEAIEGKLQSMGFARKIQGREVVYFRRNHNDNRLVVKVYTSLAANAAQARGCGQDAIRVVAAFEHGEQSFGIWKGTRIFRTGSVEAVLERMYERAREAYGACNRWIDKQNDNR